MGRMFGSREIALGAITLAASGEARPRLVQLGIAVDGADAFTGIVSAASGSVPKKAGFLLDARGRRRRGTGVMELQEPEPGTRSTDGLLDRLAERVERRT